VNEQIKATATTAQGAVERGAAATEDSWDRLAALAFGGAASAGGCSEHAHDCTCLAERAAAGTSRSQGHEVLPLWTPEPQEEPEIAD